MIKALLEIFSRELLVSIQKLAIKGITRIVMHLDSTAYKVSGDIVFRAKL